MARERLADAFNDWQANQIPASWAGEPVQSVTINFTGGGSETANPTDWVVRAAGKVFVLTDAEHAAAFEPWVP